MRMIDIIDKKRRNLEISKEEIDFMIHGFLSNEIPEYQVSAFLMAVCFNGMSDEEASNLTLSMRDSGEIMDLSSISGKIIDKHSSGGIGDKTTLVLAPLIASLGVPVSKMSGRGLGYTGGTIDKLESFPGFQTDYSIDQFLSQVKNHGIIVSSQSDALAPADRYLYGLRDATATVESIPLIASSIMSKKLASGCDGIVLDVTCGDGAFMKNIDDAKKLSELMISIGKSAGKSVVSVITSMEEPLGYAVGNTLEVKEAISALSGNGPEDLMEVVYTLGSHMLVLADKCAEAKEARKLLIHQIHNGEALSKFKEWISSQGGDASYVDNPNLFEEASTKEYIHAKKSGYISRIEARSIGDACMLLGGGRRTKGESIDSSVGIILNKKVGDFVREGELLATIHMNDSKENALAIKKVTEAIYIVDNEVVRENVILGEVF